MSENAAGSARPPGQLPKGSPFGLMALGILSGVIPFLVLQSLVPVLKNGTDIWLDSLLPDVAASAVVGAVMAFGLARRRAAYIRFVNTLGWFLLLAYAAGLLAGIAILAGMVAEQSPSLSFISVVNIVLWALVSPLAWFLLRLVRLRYWQPGTRAEDWEAPDAVPATRNTLVSQFNRDGS